MSKQNIRAFGEQPLNAVLFVATGCGTQLIAQDFPSPVMEISQFIEQQTDTDQLQFTPSGGRVALHTPCSQRHPLGAADAPAQLLGRIPQLKITQLPIGCCGAAGSYILNQPEMADSLGRLAVASLGNQRPDALLTSNSGCRLQWQYQLKQAGLDIPVMHPIEYLLQRLTRGR
jgi:glycolate oxidase iron-sulfur subunit